MKKFILSTFILLFVLIVGILLWWTNGIRAQNPKDTTQKLFVIIKGESSRQIGADLKKSGLIPDQYVFYALVKLGGFDGKIQAGDFRLSPSQTPSNILTTLTKGTLDVWITIPEGLRATEIAEKLQKNISTYDMSWSAKLQQEEGYLFPDTYLFPKDATVEQVIAIMKNNFNVKYTQASAGATTKYTQQEAVTIASLVQREGKSDADMKYIASVLENRLQLGMALQVDASVQYIIGTTFKWWPQPTSADLKIVSPYNTYKNPGLPPTPIANPGLVALTAAMHPADTNYLYYMTDKKGVTHFAKTLEEQTANITKFGL
ncbi:MAG TPA: endolytic transglycosylase MltG [Candidatus Eisenbacteria bacterium]|nr:endolytic transglycosylase MltG [Candidatus Eisenbacteria bacterium]